MVFSFNWIKEYLEGDVPNIEKVAEVLTAKSFEVESIEESGDDFLLDIDILPNRSHDCLCHAGVAKEIAMHFDLKFNYPKGVEKEPDFETDFSAEITDKRCKRYMLREVTGVKVGPSHPDLQKKMEVLGEKSINNVVDITNIILFELNQPMHAFDRDKLDGNKIFARTSKSGETMTTLDKNFVELDDETCVISDEKSPLAIAGVKGGDKAEVMEGTTNLILESANFNSSDIRKTSNKIDITTESSKRYENGITAELTETAMNRATELLLKYGGDDVKVSNVVDVYPRRPKNDFISGFSLKKVNKLLSIEISEKEVEEILNKLDFEFDKVNTKENVLNLLKDLEGKTYKYGASVSFDAPESFDCGSLVSYVYSRSGLPNPRMTVDQYFFCEPIEKSDLEAGDLIFSNTNELIEDQGNKINFESIEYMPGSKFGKGIDHVGIYLGDGKVIHATSFEDKGVCIEDIDSSKKFENITAYGRIISKGEERYVVKIPALRLDLMANGPEFGLESSLIEEIGRVYGYDKIESKPVEGLKKVQNSNQEASAILKIKSELQKLGFSEVITYSFIDKGDLKVVKALASDKEYLRTSMIKNHKEALNKNFYYKDLLGIDAVKIFEIGKVYKDSKEELKITISTNLKGKKKKPVVEELQEVLNDLGINLDFPENDDSVEISLTEEIINGIDISDDIEIEFDQETQFKALSPYPFMSRDVSVWIPNGKGDENTIFELVEKHAGELLRTKRLFDVYEKEGRTSYAVRVVFQSNERTLTDEEVGEIMDKVYADLKAMEGFEIR